MPEPHPDEIARRVVADYTDETECSDCGEPMFAAPLDDPPCGSWEHLAVFLGCAIADHLDGHSRFSQEVKPP